MNNLMNATMKIITHNVHGINNRDDETLPFKVEVEMSMPTFTKPLPIVRYGCERIVVRLSHYEAVEHLINDRAAYEDAFGFNVSIQKHPRLKSLVVTGPDGELFRLEPHRAAAN